MENLRRSTPGVEEESKPLDILAEIDKMAEEVETPPTAVSWKDSNGAIYSLCPFCDASNYEGHDPCMTIGDTAKCFSEHCQEKYIVGDPDFVEREFIDEENV